MCAQGSGAIVRHEYVGVVEEVGSEVRNVEPGQFAVVSFFASDNSCEIGSSR
jgi:Zn-dependent alcohol dehydrogenase